MLFVFYLQYKSQGTAMTASITTEPVFEIWGLLIFVKITHGQSFIIVKAY